MDGNNWRPAASGGEGAVPDWRLGLQAEARHKIVNKIIAVLKKHLPSSGDDVKVKAIAVKFEEKIYSTAISQEDYLRKISMKMMTMESRTQNSLPNSLPPNSADPGAHPSMQSQVPSQGQSLPISMPADQHQARQQLLTQNMQNPVNSTGLQSFATLPSSLPSVSGMTQTPINAPGQSASMQNMSSIAQNPVGTSLGQGVSSNMFGNPHRQMPGRNQVIGQQEQLQQSQNPQQYYQQQPQQQMLQKQRNLAHPQMHSQLQQPQQNALHSTQFQSAEQVGMQTSSVMQPSAVQSASMPSLSQNQSSSLQNSTQSMLQHPSQSVIRQQQLQQQQAVGIHQQQTPMMQQHQVLPTQQPMHLQQNQNHFAGQQNNMSDLRQQQQQQQRLINQRANHQNQQQQQQQSQQQQQMMAQQNNLSGMHQQQMGGSQSNFSGLQQPTQQQLLGTQLGNSSMQNNRHAINMRQLSKVPLQQQTQQHSSNLLPTQTQQAQSLALQQPMSQIQSHSGQLQQQQLGLQQQSTSLQREMQMRLQASGKAPCSLVQPQNDQQQLYQSQRSLPETSSTSLDSTAETGQANGADWREEVYQKIKSMKEMYLPELKEMFLKIATKLQQLHSLQPPLKADQLEKFKHYKPFKIMLERMIAYLQISKEKILPSFRENLGHFEKQIISLLMSNRPKNPMQQGQQLPTSQMQSSQQTMMNSLQRGSNIDSRQGNAMGGSLHQNAGSTSQQQGNINVTSSQSGVTMLQQSHHFQSNPNMLQQRQLKQHDQQVLQSPQFKQQKIQQVVQQLNQQVNQQQQLPTQLQAQQIPQLHQINDVNEMMKIKQGMGVVRPGVFQQHLSTGQRMQQMKPGASFPISSQQLLQTPSPQLLQHSSPQVDQQNLQPKTGTPLQSANSPFVAPSPSTHSAPSPIPGDSEKLGISKAPAQSLAIATPGISASPLLAEFASPNGAHGDTLTTGSGKSTVTALDRLIKAVKSISPEALNAAVSDISAVVNMTDRIAGSAPGNESKASVGEELATMTECRLRARNVITRDGSGRARKWRRYTSAVPLADAGASDSKQWSGLEISDLESTATSSFKKPKLEAKHALMEEIRAINQGLIDTVVDISDEDVNNANAEGKEGTIVKCSFSGVALSPDLKSQYTSTQMLPIQPLRLLVPLNYPNCSPILLDKFPAEVSKEYEDLSGKVRPRFSRSLRSLSEPMSLGEMARTWDSCARAVILEYAQQSGGGSFSSKYGAWENCFIAAA